MNTKGMNANGVKKLAVIICALMLIAVVLSGCFYHGDSNGNIFPDSTTDDILVYLKEKYGSRYDFRYTGKSYGTMVGGYKYFFDDGMEPGVKFTVTRQNDSFTDDYLQRVESSDIERSVVGSFRIKGVQSICYSTVFDDSIDYEGNSTEYGNSSSIYSIDGSSNSYNGVMSCFSYIAVNANQLNTDGKGSIEDVLSDLGRVSNMKHTVWVCLLNERDFFKAEMEYSRIPELNLTLLEGYSSCKSRSYVVTTDGIVTETTNRGKGDD